MSTLEATVDERRGIADALNKTAFSLHEQAKAAKNDPNNADLESMYRGDAADYEAILELFVNGHYKSASDFYWRMDTASRDNLFGFVSKSHTDVLERFLNC